MELYAILNVYSAILITRRVTLTKRRGILPQGKIFNREVGEKGSAIVKLG